MAGRLTKEEAIELGLRIKGRREKLRISQLELALRMGTSQRAIYAYEKGERQPTKDTLQRLAIALETTVSVLRGKAPDEDISLTVGERETLNLLDKSYKKIAFTNLKINIDLKTITEKEVKDIIDNDKIIDNIDDVIWYLYNGENSNLAVSWLRN